MVFGLLVALVVAVSMGVAATFYLRKRKQPEHETAAGIAALAGMSWRDFINLVLNALGRRGYVRVFGHEAARDDSEYVLERDGKRWLLSCKHGSAYVLGLPAVHELVNLVRLHGAAGGLLLTQGRIANEVRPVAALQRIELLDGPTLWPELRDLIGGQQLTEIHAHAEAATRRHIVFAWIAAAIVGVGIFALFPRGDDAPQPAAIQMPASRPEPPAAPASAPIPADAPIPPPAPVDEAALAKRRGDVANAISTLPMVDRAIWSTQSTLQVYLLDAESDAIGRICPLLVRYPELAASRVQLTPPPGSDRPVRFRQCRSY